MVVRMIPTFRPWTHPSDDSYIYQLSLVVGTATASLQYSAVFVFWCADRIQYDVMGFHGLLALQHLTLTLKYAGICGIYLSVEGL